MLGRVEKSIYRILNRVGRLAFKIKHIFVNKFIYDSRNYLLAEIFTKATVFLVLPIFTRILTPDEYGIISIFNTIGTIAVVFLGFNFHSSLSRKFYEKEDDFGEFVGSNIIFLSVLQCFGLILLYIFIKPLSSILRLESNLIIFGVLVSVFGFYVELLKAYLQVNQYSKRFLKISMIESSLMTIGSLFMVWILAENRYLGKIYAQLLITGSIGMYAYRFFWKISRKNFSWNHIKYSLVFGIPLIPHALSSFILNEFDKIIINQIVGLYETGLYAFAYNIGMLMMAVVIATNSAWVPIFYDRFNNNRLDEINRYVRTYSKFIVFIAINLMLFSNYIVEIIAVEKYLLATEIVPIIILSYVFVFLYTLYSQYAIYSKKTVMVSIFTFASGAMNIILNYIYIPIYGYKAAAYTTLASYIFLWALHYINSYVLYKSKIIPFRIIINKILFLLIYFAIAQITKDFSYSIILKIVLSISSLCLFYNEFFKRGEN